MRQLGSCSAFVVLLLLAVATATAADAFAATPTIAAGKMNDLWTVVADARPTDATTVGPFHMYRDLDAVPASAVRASDACAVTHTTLEDRTECKRAAMGFTAADVTALSQWLAPIGDTTLTHEQFRHKAAKGCHIAWNAVHCRGATVASLSRIFGAQATFQAMRKNDNLKKKKKKQLTAAPHIFTTDALVVPGALELSAGIAHVSGLHPYDWIEQSARHMGRAGNPNAEPTRKQGAAGLRDPTSTLSPDPYNQYEWRQDTYESANEWATQNYGSASPIIYHMSEGFAYVMPVCGDGYLAQFWPSTTWSGLCGVHSPAPAKVTVNVTRFADGRAGASVFTGDVDPNHCQQASAYTEASNGVICRIYIAAAFQGASEWEQFTVSVTETFPDNSPAPMTGLYKNFMNDVTYAVGQSDIYGEYITTTVATPSMTQPSGPGVTPSVILSQYGVPASARADSMVQGVVEFSDADEPGNGFQDSDLQQYLTQIAHLPTASSSQWQVVGDQTIVSSGETTLDIELVMGVARGARSYIYCISYGTGGDYASYSDALAGFASSAMGAVGPFGISVVWSISYGGPEWTSSPSLMRHVNSLFAHLADSGVTVTASSGDTGCYFITPSQVYHSANWPATSPYVVGVGATAFTSPAAGGASSPLEEVCNVRNGNVITSGGGYSGTFSRPDYQSTAVANSMLGMPDVAAIGAWITTILDGRPQFLFGTSASSPIIAALITLMNQQRFDNYVLNSSKPSGPLRQAPKFLYDASFNNPASFRDIFVGDNCNSEAVGPLSGNFPTFARPNCYDASTGWDAVTGLGVPSYRQLLPRAAAWNPPALPSDKKQNDTEDTIIGAIVIGVGVLGSILVFAVCRMRRRRPAPYQAPPTAPVIGTAYQAFPVNGQPVAAQHAGAIYADNAV